jgi:pyruvate dehydrogenase E1 component
MAASQSYPSRTKDVDDVDFSTGSVGLGVADHGVRLDRAGLHRRQGLGRGRPLGRMVALVGDAELDEGNVYEAFRRAGRTTCATPGGSSTTTASRSTGSCMRGCSNAIEKIFEAFGWDVVASNTAPAARRLRRAGRRQALRDWIDACPNQLYSALTFRAVRSGASA